MPTYLPIALVGLVAVVLLVWSVTGHFRRRQTLKAALAQLGFTPCPEQKTWLEETVARIENNRGYHYEIRDPRRLPGEPPVFHYVKVSQRFAHDDPVVEEQILFPVTRKSARGLVLTVKPSSIAPGLATRMLGALATGPWDTQPDDLHPLELPPDLKDTNVLAALGASGASLYDLIDARTLSVVQGLGDAGGMFVQFRDGWCTVGNTSEQIPFLLEDLVARIRPLLGKVRSDRP